MDIRVAGHQVDTGESLREHAQQRVAEITEKYFSRAIGANVTFGRGPTTISPATSSRRSSRAWCSRRRTARASARDRLQRRRRPDRKAAAPLHQPAEGP